jgi:hypothetical protein
VEGPVFVNTEEGSRHVENVMGPVFVNTEDGSRHVKSVEDLVSASTVKENRRAEIVKEQAFVVCTANGSTYAWNVVERVYASMVNARTDVRHVKEKGQAKRSVIIYFWISQFYM